MSLSNAERQARWRVRRDARIEGLRRTVATARAQAAEIKRLQLELDKAHRLLGQFMGWQREAEIVKVKQQQQIEQLQAALKEKQELQP